MIRRGREVSRIEGFSDAVFGFALTLLVASIEVPPDFGALKQTLRGFLPFASDLRADRGFGTCTTRSSASSVSKIG